MCPVETSVTLPTLKLSPTVFAPRTFPAWSNKDHSFDNRKDGESIFYGRDRGEKGNMTSNWKNRDKVKFDSGEEYAYIYNLKEKKWYYKSKRSNPQDWTELK